MSGAKIVLDLEREHDGLKERHAEVVAFLREVGEKDPRSGGFIAERVLAYLGEPSNMLVAALAAGRAVLGDEGEGRK